MCVSQGSLSSIMPISLGWVKRADFRGKADRHCIAALIALCLWRKGDEYYEPQP